MAYLVVRRTREIGIRVALGAQPGMVVRMVMGEVLAFAAGGILTALLAAFALARLAGPTRTDCVLDSIGHSYILVRY